MRKESFFLSLLRLLLLGALVAFLAMIYWSLLLLEEDVRELKNEYSQFKELPRLAQESPVNTTIKKNLRPHLDPALPNLLVEDPFYTETLPKLLGPNFQPKGIRKTASAGKPDNLHPLSNWSHVSTWQGLCGVSVAKSQLGFFESYVPNAAFKVEERIPEGGQSVEYWIHLREGMLWQPLKQKWFAQGIRLAPHFLKKHPLTAHDFKFYFDVMMNPFISEPRAVVMRQYYADIEEVRVLDDLTFVVRWKSNPTLLPDGTTQNRPKYLAKSTTLSMSPLPCFVYQYYPDGKKIVEEDQALETYQTNSTFAQSFTEHWAKNVIPSCGPMCFEGMTDETLRFSRNPDYFSPLECLVEGLQVDFKQSDENIWNAFKQGSLDEYSMQPDHQLEFESFIRSQPYLAQEEQGLKIQRLEYLFRAFSYIGWNEARPLFRSKKVRKAMTLAIDRPRIIREVAHGMGIEIATPYYPYSSAYDTSIHPWPFDPVAARRLLEEEGFADTDGDGILSKMEGNQKLKAEFTLSYYVKNPTTKAIAEFIATGLKEIGVKCKLNGTDLADISALFDDKNFDAYILAWVLASPPEDLRQLWHSSGAKEKGSSNSIGFSNPEVDQIIEQLTYEYDPEKRTRLYHRFGAIFHEENPYTLLYVPRIAFLYRDYLKNVFLPVDRQDLIPGAVVGEPDSSIFWINKK